MKPLLSTLVVMSEKKVPYGQYLAHRIAWRAVPCYCPGYAPQDIRRGRILFCGFKKLRYTTWPSTVLGFLKSLLRDCSEQRMARYPHQ
jgi:hypothetical protein